MTNAPDTDFDLDDELEATDGWESEDFETGYADEPEAVADYVSRLDVAGINIEDSTADTLVPARSHAAKIAAIKARTPALFVNARVDTYWLHQDETLAATLDRALAYVDAGADGVFRFRPDGLNDRALAVQEIRGGGAVTVNAAPRALAPAGT